MNETDRILYGHFRNAGYLRLPMTIEPTVIEEMKRIVRDHIERQVQPFRVNASKQVRRLDQLLDRHPVFLDALRRPDILKHLILLLGPNIEVSKVRHNHATVNYAGDIPFRLHRDVQQWSRSIATAMIYLEETRIDNGCTHVVPSSQFAPYAGSQSDEGGGNWADEHEEYKPYIGQEVPVPMPYGGILVVDSLTFHTVGRNLTNGSRMSLTFALHSINDLDPNLNDSKSVLLTGVRRYTGTDYLRISGSMAKGG